jgi:hypothetical protein
VKAGENVSAKPCHQKAEQRMKIWRKIWRITDEIRLFSQRIDERRGSVSLAG